MKQKEKPEDLLKYQRPKRFIVRIICNNCGIMAPCQYSWLPDEKIYFICHNCHEEEIFCANAMRAKQEEEQKENMTLSKEESKLLNEMLERKDKKYYGKD